MPTSFCLPTSAGGVCLQTFLQLHGVLGVVLSTIISNINLLPNAFRLSQQHQTCSWSMDHYYSKVARFQIVFQSKKYRLAFAFFPPVVSGSVWMHLADFPVVQLLLCITSTTAETCVCLQPAFNLNTVDVMKASVKAVQVLAVAE